MANLYRSVSTHNSFHTFHVSFRELIPPLGTFLSTRNFKRLKILRNGNTTLVRQNKRDVIKKGLEITGIVKPVTKELEPEDPFTIVLVDL